MKRIGLFSILLLIITSFASLKGQWEVLNEGYPITFVDFVSKDIGWALIDDSIVKTTNGGKSWDPDPRYHDVDPERILYGGAIDFVNDSMCWMIGMPGTEGLYKTIDGGMNWEKCLEKGGQLQHVSEDMVIVQSGWGDSLELLKSTDSGITWEDITPEMSLPEPHSFSFINQDTGVFIAERNYDENQLIRTFDGGKTWQQIELPELDHLSEIAFIDNLNGYFVERQGFSNDKIFKTQDAFDTWTVVAENQHGIYSCLFFDNDIGIALMGDSLGCNILKSYDGGRSWGVTESIRLPHHIYNMNFSKNSDGIIHVNGYYGDVSILLESKDMGDSWSMLNLSYPFMDVCFLNASKGFIAWGDFDMDDEYGGIFMSTDGGSSWNSQPIRFGYDIVDCDFVNDTMGFAYNCVGYTAQTMDGGQSWNRFNHELDRYTKFKFIDEQVGFAGNDSGIYISNNGGESWELLIPSQEAGSVIGYPSYFIPRIVQSDDNIFWTIASKPGTFKKTVIRFTNQGDWKEIKLESEPQLTEMFFTDRNTGWITSGSRWYDYDPTLYRTEDGGESWSRTNFQYQFSDIIFKDSLHGWAVGSDSLYRGLILESKNRGKGWTVQVDSLNAPLNGIEYKDGVVWAVGFNGLILSMYDSAHVSAIEHSRTVIDGNLPIKLYPNPTNSIVNIETLITGQHFIELFNLNGQLLFRTKATGSTHQLDLSSFQKGIYFITIRTKDFVTTRKIIKL